MWPEPDDPFTVRRMRAARHYASEVLRVKVVSNHPEVWGWHGRTIGAQVVASDGSAWLRIAAAHTDQIIDTFWHGGVVAQQHIPSTIPRPHLQRWHDWTDEPWIYRAELYEYIAACTAADRPVITSAPDLPASWWTDVRFALSAIAAIRTDRMTTQPGFLNWAMPHYLGVSHADYTHIPWTTAHGDFHLANLCSPDLTILDWEGWGLAPPGYDAATLHSYSILSTETAPQVQRELGHMLTTANGGYAELAVIAELLHAATEGTNPELVQPLLQRAASVKERLAS